MPANNIIELGFSPDVVQEKGKIIEALNEVYKSAKKIDGLRIEIKMSDSLKEFRKVVKDLEDQYAVLTSTIKNYNQVLEEHFKQQQKAAEAQKKEAQAAAATAQANQQSAKSVQDLNIAYGSMLGNIEGSINALNQLKAGLRENQQAQNNLNTAYQAGRISADDYNSQLIALEKQEKLLGQSIRQMNLYITSQAKELIATEDSYDQLNAKLLQLERTWKTLSKTDRESQIGVDLQKEVAAARAELTKLDETIGNHQRKVGNYAGAWNGLGNSVNQLTRELPAFANSLQTGFMGISNNIPILADEIKRIRLENAALRAEGLPTTSVLKQLASAFLSWNTALSLGVALLVFYGKEIGDWIARGGRAATTAEKMADAQKQYNKELYSSKAMVDDYKNSLEQIHSVQKSSTQQTAQQVSHLKTLQATMTDTNLTLSKRQIAYEEAVKLYPSYLAKISEEDALSGGLAKTINTKLVPALIAAGKARAAQGVIDLKQTKLFNIDDQVEDLEKFAAYYDRVYKESVAKRDLYTDPEKTGIKAREQFNLITQRIKELRGQQKGLNDDITKYTQLQFKYISESGAIGLDGKDDAALSKLKNAASKLLEARKKANEARLQQVATVNKALSEQESLGYAARQGFLKKYFEVQQQIIAENAAYELKRAGITNDEKLAIQEEAASKSLALTAKYLADNAKLQEKADADEKAQYLKDLEDIKSSGEKGGKNLIAAKNKSDNSMLDSLKNGASLMNKLYESNYIEQEAALTESLNNKEISQKDYEEKMYQLKLKYSKDTLNRTIADAEQQMKYTTGATKEFYDLKNAIAEAKKELADIGKAESLHGLEKLRSSIEKINERTQALTSIMGKLNDIGYNNQKAELEELSQKMDDNYAKEIENINNSALTEEQKANKLKIVEAKRDAQKIAIEKRQKQADIDKANFDRLTNIANIISGTALAVVKALPNIPLAVTVGAIGAAELAAAVATKVPKYADGTEDHPGGPAIVGEGKHKELVMTPDGKVSIADKPTLLDLPQHSQVVPITPELIQSERNYQWQQLFQMAKIRKDDYAELTYQQLKRLTRTMEKKSEGKTHVHNNIKVDLGWYNYTQRNLRGI